MASFSRQDRHKRLRAKRCDHRPAYECCQLGVWRRKLKPHAVRILLTRTANEGSLPFELSGGADHDAWFRAKVLEALDDSRPAVPHDEVERHSAARRAAALRKAAETED